MITVQEKLLNLQDIALSEIKEASTIEELESLRVKYSGKKGQLTAIMKEMGKLFQTKYTIGVDFMGEGAYVESLCEYQGISV